MQHASTPAPAAVSALARREIWMLLAGLLSSALLLRLWPRTAGMPWWLWLPAAALLLLAVLGLSQILLMLWARAISRRCADPTPAVTWPGVCDAALREARACLSVFTFEQAFRWRDYPDSLPGGAHDSTQPPLVLIHGYVCNRGIWRRWMHELTHRNWPYASVNLEPVFGSIDRYLPLVDDAVARAATLGACRTLGVESENRPQRDQFLPDLQPNSGSIGQKDGEKWTAAADLQPTLPKSDRLLGSAKPWLVCHSMGGLVARAWAAATPDAEQRIAGIVTLGTPHRGTWLSRLAYTPNGQQMRQHSPWLQALQRREAEQSERLSQIPRLSVHAQTDQIVFPPATATFQAGKNWLVAGVGHVAMARDVKLLARILTWIETRGGAKPAECR